MKCSRCYVSIPPGQEIQKGSIFWFWGQETVCPKCAVIRDKQKKGFWIILIGIGVLALVIPLIIGGWTGNLPKYVN